jgi:hypothetical protein
LLNAVDQEPTLEYLVESRKQSDPKEAEKPEPEPEPEPEPKEPKMTASEFAEGLRLIEADAKLLEDIGPSTSNK